jgi:hypothetical protein
MRVSGTGKTRIDLREDVAHRAGAASGDAGEERLIRQFLPMGISDLFCC